MSKKDVIENKEVEEIVEEVVEEVPEEVVESVGGEAKEQLLEVTSDNLGIRKGPSVDFPKYQVNVGTGKSDVICKRGVYTYTQIAKGGGARKGWAEIGKDKWICLDYCKLL